MIDGSYCVEMLVVWLMILPKATEGSDRDMTVGTPPKSVRLPNVSKTLQLAVTIERCCFFESKDTILSSHQLHNSFSNCSFLNCNQNNESPSSCLFEKAASQAVQNDGPNG